MKMQLSEIANLVQGVVLGDGTTPISMLSPIDEIVTGSLVFADSEEHFKVAEHSSAAAIIVSHSITQANKPLVQVKNPFQAFIRLLDHFFPAPKIQKGIHPTAVIGEGVQLGKDVFIGPYVVIEAGSSIGDNCVLKSHVHIGSNVIIGPDSIIHAHVSIYDNTHIGSRVIIHASTVIGSDGFGYTFADGRHLKVPHVGRVVIEDDVEIGSNTAIDRATLGETVIGEGTKIDNLVQVAHSVKLGKHNILCGFTGIAGSTVTGDNVVCAANVGVSDHVRIDDGVILGARTGVPPKKHLRSGAVYLGNPARPKEVTIKNELAVNRIPLMRKNIQNLMEQVALLTKQFKKGMAE